jgi:predicted nucleic acid-binding Zn finger protein
MSERQQKSLEIAARTKIKKNGQKWVVPSQTGNGTSYTVDLDSNHCTCPDHETRQVKCKHIFAVEYTIEREQSITETVSNGVETTTVTETVKLRYKQVWSAYNTAQVNEKAKFLALLFELCSNVDEPIQTMGRTRIPMKDMLFATAFKVYSAVRVY